MFSRLRNGFKRFAKAPRDKYKVILREALSDMLFIMCVMIGLGVIIFVWNFPILFLWMFIWLLTYGLITSIVTYFKMVWKIGENDE